MKKHLAFTITLLLVTSLLGMKRKSGKEPEDRPLHKRYREQTLPVITSNSYSIPIPMSLANQSGTIQKLLQDLPDKDVADVSIPLPKVTATSLNYLRQYHSETDFSTKPLNILLELLGAAEYLEYNGQHAIAGRVFDALSIEENRIKFLTGNLDLNSYSGTDLLKRPFMQKMNSYTMKFALAKKPRTLKVSGKSIAISRDGKCIAIAPHRGKTNVWNIETGKKLCTLEPHSTNLVGISPNNNYVVTVIHNRAQILDMCTQKLNEETDKIKRILRHISEEHRETWEIYEQINSVAISPDSTRVVTVSDDGTAKIWDMKTGSILYTLEGHREKVLSVAISPDGNYVVTGSMDETVRIWDLKMGNWLSTLEDHDPIYRVGISFDSKYIITCSFSTGKIWDIETGKKMHTLKPTLENNFSINSVALSSTGNYLVIGCEERDGLDDGTATVWNIETGEKLHTVKHTLKGRIVNYERWPCTTIEISSDNKFIINALDDKTVKIWELETGEELHTLPSFTPFLKSLHIFIESIAISPDSRHLVIGGMNKTQIWNLKDEALERSFESSHINQIMLSYLTCFYPKEVKEYRNTEYMKNLMRTSPKKIKQFIRFVRRLT